MLALARDTVCRVGCLQGDLKAKDGQLEAKDQQLSDLRSQLSKQQAQVEQMQAQLDSLCDSAKVGSTLVTQPYAVIN